MGKLSLLFLFVLLFSSSYSIRPKMDKKEFPKNFNNKTMIGKHFPQQNKPKAHNISIPFEPHWNWNKKDKRGNHSNFQYDKWKKKNFDRHNHNHNKDNKLDKYDEYKYNRRNHFYKNGSNEGGIHIAIILMSIWCFIFLLYILINRRKKPIISMLKNPEQINLSQYHNV